MLGFVGGISGMVMLGWHEPSLGNWCLCEFPFLSLGFGIYVVLAAWFVFLLFGFGFGDFAFYLVFWVVCYFDVSG